jgi:acetylornithine/succinyldiaminopimelate/putrescine aminotransferase
MASLPEPLEKTYLVNSGRSYEGALKLARRVTGRSQLISATMLPPWKHYGIDECYGLWRAQTNFRPLIPDVDFITFNNEADLEKITKKRLEYY